MSTIFLPEVPSPNGFFHSLLFSIITETQLTISSGITPASMFDLTSSVSGRSVLSRRVTHGIPRIHVSSWIPPESVRTSFAFCSSCKKENRSNGSMRVTPSDCRLCVEIIFCDRG